MVLAFAEPDDVLGLTGLLAGIDVDLHVHRLDHVEALGGLEEVSRDVTAGQHLRRPGQPRRLEFREIPKMLVCVDDRQQLSLLCCDEGRCGAQDARRKSCPGGMVNELSASNVHGDVTEEVEEGNGNPKRERGRR